ncbi:hypothetical protein KR009_006417 [Drosophila setifemur]|nr:hypothetical protein KR009_006417 [Drosophila setifemur]
MNCNRYYLLFLDDDGFDSHPKDLKIRAKKPPKLQSLGNNANNTNANAGKKSSSEGKFGGKKGFSMNPTSKKEPMPGKKEKSNGRKDNVAVLMENVAGKKSNPTPKKDASNPKKVLSKSKKEAPIPKREAPISKKGKPYTQKLDSRNFALPPDYSPDRKPSRGSNRSNLSRHRFDRPNLDRTSRTRLHDRQSGSDRTGVKAVDKRNGGGAHNWGSPLLDIQEHTKFYGTGPSTSKAGKKSKRSKSDSDVSTQSEANALEDSVDEPVQFTLDEWRAMQKKAAAQRKGMVEVVAEEAAAAAAAAADVPKSGGGQGAGGQRCERMLRLLVVHFNFYDERRRYRLANKVTEEPDEFPEVNDKIQFPSLS